MADSRTYLCEIVKADAEFLISIKDVIADRINGEITDSVDGNKKKKKKKQKTLFAFRTKRMPGSIGVLIKDNNFAFVSNNHSGQSSHLKRVIIMTYLQKMMQHVFKKYGFRLIAEGIKETTFSKKILAGELQVKMQINHDNDKVRFEYEGGNVRFNVMILEIREILEQKGIRLFQPRLKL